MSDASNSQLPGYDEMMAGQDEYAAEEGCEAIQLVSIALGLVYEMLSTQGERIDRIEKKLFFDDVTNRRVQ